jgi:hypothetical protein
MMGDIVLGLDVFMLIAAQGMSRNNFLAKLSSSALVATRTWLD